MTLINPGGSSWLLVLKSEIQYSELSVTIYQSAQRHIAENTHRLYYKGQPVGAV